MNKETFLKELEKRLRYIPAEDRADAIEYYEGYIQDMELAGDEDVVSKLGTPKEVAKTILDECTNKHIDRANEQKTVLIGQPPFKRLYFNRSCQFHPLIRIRWGFGAASSSCHVPSRPDRTEPSSPVHALPLRDRCSRWRYHPDDAV